MRRPVTGRALIDGMQKLSDPNAISITSTDFAAGYSALAGGGTINYAGASGPVDFDPNTGDILSATVEIWNIDNSTSPPTFRTLQIVTP